MARRPTDGLAGPARRGTPGPEAQPVEGSDEVQTGLHVPPNPGWNELAIPVYVVIVPSESG